MTLEVRDLRHAHAGRPPALRGASLTVPAGTSAFLLGPSGSGKTTLLRCIAGLEPSYAGSVAWDGMPLDGLPPHRRRVGMLFQEPALFPHLTVWRNVAFGLRYRNGAASAPDVAAAHRLRFGASRLAERGEAERWLEMVGLAPRAEARVDELSGGERQRVALVRTLAARPRIVLLDEPMSALDRDLRDDLGPRVKRLLAEQGVAALWVTHDRDEARRLADRAWRLVDGRTEPWRPEGGAP